MTPIHDHDRSPARLPELLLGYRLAAGLTQAELATRADVSVRTVRDLERGRSVRPQRMTVELLAAALQLDDADRVTFLAAARGNRRTTPTGTSAASVGAGRPDPGAGAGEGTRRPAPDLPVVDAVNRLPSPIDLIGRDDEVAEVTALLSPAEGRPSPVVSLVGLAGVGKTALALSIAREVPARHRAGVLVGEGSDVGDVLTAVAAVFGVARPAELVDRLAEDPALLVVDAVERAPDAVAEALARLTGHLPGLRVLTTGRHPVGLPGERVRPVTPLDVPSADDPTALAANPATRLFLTRLGQVRREPPRPDELAALATLVRRLGGLPLAIELVAARGRILDLNDMLDRYGDRILDLATPPVPRSAVALTLRDAVATSYHLLEPVERKALRRLSAFRNRWSLALAEELLTADGDGCGAMPGDAVGTDLVALLDRLLELGLLNVRGSGEFRFRLLDVVRDFAAEQATVSGEATLIRRRHAAVLSRWAGRVGPELAGTDPGAAVRLFDEVSSDLSAALAHAANDDPYTALALAAGLARWWRFRGRDVFGRQWLRRLLDDPRTLDADPSVRADARLGMARLAAEHRAGAEELPAARAALAEYRRVGDVRGELDARTVLCALLTASGGYDEARDHGEAALTLAARTGRIRDLAVAQVELTRHDIRGGALGAARRRLAVVDRLAARCGDARLRALARADLAEVDRLDGRYADAVRQGRRAVGALRELGDPGHRRRALGTVGLALAQDGRFDEAAAVLAELRSGGPWELCASGLSELAGPGSDPTDRPDEVVCAAIEGHLALRRGDREWAAEWFSAAAAASRREHRATAEALVGLVASTVDPQARAATLDRLARTCRVGGVTLLPAEHDLIGAIEGGSEWRSR